MSECKRKYARNDVRQRTRLSVEQFEKLSTKRLLAYRKGLYGGLGVHDDYVWDCDCSFCMSEKETYKRAGDTIDMINKILNTREHVPRKTRPDPLRAMKKKRKKPSKRPHKSWCLCHECRTKKRW